ncbi:MAG: protein kinase [Clostridia bacterium]|nr:protein kinase [Clostridia bacterium]
MNKMIKGYRQETQFVNAGAGTSTWCIATKGGQKYFIKSFLEVTLVDEETAKNLPAPMVDAKRKSCVQFRVRKERLYNKLNEIQNGIFISPIELIVYNGHFCAVTDYVDSFADSNSIHQLLPRRKTILMRTLILAMRDLANNHIVHSDIKPDNIIITYNQKKIPQLKIIDFDSGFFEDAPPRNVNDYHGDMVYFAPESMVFLQSEGEADVRLTCAVDKFAVGLLLHKMWCGELPSYDTNECANAAEALLLDKPITLHHSIPAQLAAVINGFLREDPNSRISYDQAYHLLGDYLDELAPDQPVSVNETEVCVNFVDTKGKVLESTTLKIAPGSELVVVPKEIAGYKCLDSKRLLHVDAHGRADESTIEFKYKKTGRKLWKWLTGCLAVVLLCWLYAVGYIDANVEHGNWYDAYHVGMRVPFYNVLFPDKMETIQYNYGIRRYRMNYYEEAFDVFSSISSEYKDCGKYLTLCSTHEVWNTREFDFLFESIFDSLIEMGSFEDTEKVILEGINNAIIHDDWEEANYYISKYPRYEDLYSEEVNQLHYYYGVDLFDSQQYKQASAEFSSVGASAFWFDSEAEDYLTLCRAHIDGAESCMDELKEILWREETQELILYNYATLGKFMLGTWSVKTSGTSCPDLIMQSSGTGHYSIINLPDTPGGGTWSIKNRIIRYESNGVTQDLHKVEIISTDFITFTNCSTQTIYDLVRQEN